MSPTKPRKNIFARAYHFTVKHAVGAGKIASAIAVIVSITITLWKFRDEKNADMALLKSGLDRATKAQQIVVEEQLKTNEKFEDLRSEVAEIRGGVNTLLQLQGVRVPVATKPLTLEPSGGTQ
jgi:hypothetical protein